MPRAWSAKRERQYECVKQSVEAQSSGRRGGLRSGTKRPKGRTTEQLCYEARKLGVAGRSTMDKAPLQRAVER